MNDSLKRFFGDLDHQLNSTHAEQRQTLMRELPSRAALSRPSGLRKLAAAAALLVILGLSGSWLLLSQLLSRGIVWAANPEYRVSAGIIQKKNGLIWTRFKIERVLKEKTEVLSEPQTTVVEGQNATIEIIDAQRKISISQILAKGAKEALVVVTITGKDNAIEWATALTVSVAKN